MTDANLRLISPARWLSAAPQEYGLPASKTKFVTRAAMAITLLAAVMASTGTSAVADDGPTSSSVDCGCVTMVAPYNGTSGTTYHHLSMLPPTVGKPSAHFSLLTRERQLRLRHLQVTVVDQVSRGPIQFEVYQQGRKLGLFCYQSPRITLPRPATTLDVFVYTGICKTGISVPVSGGIQAVVTR
jgi:hypothetical protein